MDTHCWEGTRALALIAFGPEDPRVWTTLSRSARAFANVAIDPEETDPATRALNLRAATAIAEGTLEAFAQLGRHRFPAEELAFAELTLAALRSKSLHGGYGRFAAAPARSLAEAMDPEAMDPKGASLPPRQPARPSDDPREGPFLSVEELRRELSRAEGPQGPGPGSREALALASRLGQELWDSGNWESAKEAKDLAREASLGLDRLLGPAAPEALAAKERLARLLVGLPGYGGLPRLYPKIIRSRVKLEAGIALFRELEELAPRSGAGRRAATLAAAAELVANGGDWSLIAGPKRLSSLTHPNVTRLSTEGKRERAREGYDLALLALLAGQPTFSAQLNSRVLSLRESVLGGRHPETACSLALFGVYLPWDKGSNEYLALALEAIAGRGGRYVPFEAELKLLLGQRFARLHDFGPAASILAEADELFRASWGEACQKRLKCAAWRALALILAEDFDGALKFAQSLVKLLDGAPARSDPDPESAPDETILALALAMAGSAHVIRGERETGERFILRASEIRAGQRALNKASNIVVMADVCQSALMASARAGDDSAAFKDALIALAKKRLTKKPEK
jgi:hypothetical protein